MILKFANSWLHFVILLLNVRWNCYLIIISVVIMFISLIPLEFGAEQSTQINIKWIPIGRDHISIYTEHCPLWTFVNWVPVCLITVHLIIVL